MREGEGLKGCSARGTNDTIQEKLDEILKSALLNNTENTSKIKAAFTIQPDQVKLCVQVQYAIKCTDENQCETNFNCSDGYNNTLIWTSINPSSLSGSFLFGFASINWEFFGFEWMGACDISIENTQLLNIEVPSLMLLCDVDDGRKYLNESLRRLTIQVSYTIWYFLP